MRKLLVGIIIFAISLTWVLSQAQESSIKGNHRGWYLLITPQTKKQYLDSVSAAWEKDSINLSFSKLEYTAEGKLLKIKGSVYIERNDKQPSGTFSSDSLNSYKIMVDNRWSLSISGK